MSDHLEKITKLKTTLHKLLERHKKNKLKIEKLENKNKEFEKKFNNFLVKENEDTELIIKLDKKIYSLREENNQLREENAMLKEELEKIKIKA
jgi:hypothetical protein